MTLDRNFFIQERNFDEKRDFIRLRIESRLGIKNPTTPDIKYGLCKNLSASGIQFETQVPYKKGTKLEIALTSSSEKFDNLKAEIEVVRVETHASKGVFLVSAKVSKLL